MMFLSGITSEHHHCGSVAPIFPMKSHSSSFPFPSHSLPSALSMALSAQFEAAREGGREAQPPRGTDGRRGFLRPHKPDSPTSEIFLARVSNALNL